MPRLINRDNIHLFTGITVFILAFILLYYFTSLTVIDIFGVALLLSIASDVTVIIDNERRNSAADAKFYHRNELVGEIACVVEEFRPGEGAHTGKIEIRGEKWRARSRDQGLTTGDQVRIIDRTGMTFTVTKC